MLENVLVLVVLALISADTGCVNTSAPSTLPGTSELNSGIKGTTRSVVISGVPGGSTTGGPGSVAFAIAPVEGDTPVYGKAIFVQSDADGKFKVKLPPGRYWIGPKAKALDPVEYVPGPVVLSEMVVVVKPGESIQVEIVQNGYAP